MREGIVKQKGTELGDFKNQPHCGKWECLLQKNTEQSFSDKEIMLQLRDSPVISEEVRDRAEYTSRNTASWNSQKERKSVWRKWSDFWNSIGLDNRNRAVQLQTCFNLQEKERMTLKVTEVHEATTLYRPKAEAAPSLASKGRALSESCGSDALWSHTVATPLEPCWWHCHPSQPRRQGIRPRG